jgi:hypothetical protein
MRFHFELPLLEKKSSFFVFLSVILLIQSMFLIVKMLIFMSLSFEKLLFCGKKLFSGGQFSVVSATSVYRSGRKIPGLLGVFSGLLVLTNFNDIAYFLKRYVRKTYLFCSRYRYISFVFESKCKDTTK